MALSGSNRLWFILWTCCKAKVAPSSQGTSVLNHSVMPAQLLERYLCTVWSSHVHNVNKRDARLHTLQSLHSQVVHSRTMRPRERAWRFPSTYRGTVCRAAHWRFPCRQRRKLVGHLVRDKSGWSTYQECSLSTTSPKGILKRDGPTVILPPQLTW